MAVTAGATLAPSSSRSQATVRPSTFLTGNAILRRGACMTAPPVRSRHHRALVVAAREDAAADAAAAKIKLERRELLLAASAAAVHGGVGAAQATPVGDPDLKSCGPGEVYQKSNVSKQRELLQLACCAPKAKGAPIDFTADKGDVRIRKPAHLLDADYITKYDKAYAAMKALPGSDPRSLKQQANVHCAYCNFAYRQTGDKKAQLQIHNGWLFLPWHRFYLYFHEKILGDLIGDPTFALPFWNWDNQDGGSRIPCCFQHPASDLYDKNRDPKAMTSMMDLSNGKSFNGAEDKVRLSNLNYMHQNVVLNRGAESFMGSPVRFGQKETGPGRLESAPHTTAHIFAGSPNSPFNEDMGNFYSAGRDPLFYCHHSNVDRMWNVWESLEGTKTWDDSDFLETEFFFFNEKSEMVRCKVRDCLNSEKDMKYKYEDMTASDNKWINHVPELGRSSFLAEKGGTATVVGQSNLAMAAGYPTLSNLKLQGEPLASSVLRPKQAGATDEILVLEGVEVPMNSNAGFDVFINFPEADKSTSINVAEYVGSMFNVPHFMPGMSEDQTTVSSCRFSILENVKTLGVTDASELTVTLVPKGNEPIKVKSARFEYYS